MRTVNSTMLIGSKGTGLALMAGVVLTIVAGLFFPGGPFVSPVDQTDFAAAIVPLGEQAVLGHVMTMLLILGMLFYAYGFVALYRLGNGERSLGSTALRLGVVTSLFGWGIFVLGLAQRHMVIYLMQRSLDSAESAEAQAQLAQFALDVQIDIAGLLMGFLWLYPVASALTGIGLAGRFSGLNAFKLASYVLVIIGVGAIINFLIALLAPGLDTVTLLLVNNVFQMIGALALFVIGLGLYQGRRELVPAEESSG